MKPTIHFLLIIAVLFNMISCGSEPTEEDKYPEMAIFPNTDNPNIKITEVPDFNHLYNIDETFFLADRSYLYYFKKDCYTKKDSIKIYSDNFITESGMLYSTDYDENKAFKVDVKTKKKRRLRYHPFNPSEEFEILLKKLEDKELPKETDFDDISKSRSEDRRKDTVSTEIADKFFKTIIPGLQKVTPIGKYFEQLYILTYDNKEVLLKGLEYLGNENGELINPKTFFTDYAKYSPMKDYSFQQISILTQCDGNVVTGNTLTSGYASKVFATLSYDQSGFSYYQLQYGEDVVNFKSGLYSSLKAILLPDNKTTILQTSYYNGNRYNYTNYVLSKEDL